MHRHILPAAALAVALAIAPHSGFAQTSAASPSAAAGLGGTGNVEAITVRAKIRSVNMKTREVTLVAPDGSVFTVHAGDQVQNLPQVKAGDTIVVHYTRSSVVVLGQPGVPVPPDTLTVAGGKAAPGQLPAGGLGAKLVVTGTVVGIDMADHTLQVVNPKGGRIVTVQVTDPQRQQDMARVKVGDSLTVVYTEAVAIAIEPAAH